MSISDLLIMCLPPVLLIGGSVTIFLLNKKHTRDMEEALSERARHLRNMLRMNTEPASSCETELILRRLFDGAIKGKTVYEISYPMSGMTPDYFIFHGIRTFSSSGAYIEVTWVYKFIDPLLEHNTNRIIITLPLSSLRNTHVYAWPNRVTCPKCHVEDTPDILGLCPHCTWSYK